MTYLSLIFAPLISLQEIREVLFGIEKLLFDFFGFFSWVRTSLYLVMFFQVMLIMRYIVACLKFLPFVSQRSNQSEHLFRGHIPGLIVDGKCTV